MYSLETLSHISALLAALVTSSVVTYTLVLLRAQPEGIVDRILKSLPLVRENDFKSIPADFRAIAERIAGILGQVVQKRNMIMSIDLTRRNSEIGFVQVRIETKYELTNSSGETIQHAVGLPFSKSDVDKNKEILKRIIVNGVIVPAPENTDGNDNVQDFKHDTVIEPNSSILVNLSYVIEGPVPFLHIFQQTAITNGLIIQLRADIDDKVLLEVSGPQQNFISDDKEFQRRYREIIVRQPLFPGDVILLGVGI